MMFLYFLFKFMSIKNELPSFCKHLITHLLEGLKFILRFKIKLFNTKV